MKPPPRKDSSRHIGRGRWTCRHRCFSPRLAAVGIAWLLLGLSSMHGQRAKPTEYEVKATYLYNFSRFVEWPAKVTHAQGGSFVICVLGKDPFGASLNAILADEATTGKTIVAQRIPTPQDAVNCRVLFISSSEDTHLKQILATLGQASVLTVSELPEFTQRGGMVQFVSDGNRVRFEVNLASAEHAGLTLSSELLKVAVNVRRTARLGD